MSQFVAVKGIIRAMSETTENTQPVNIQNSADTQNIKSLFKKKKPGKFLGLLINFLVFLLIIGLGIFGGYQGGIGIRKNAQKSLETQQLSDQFSRAIVDIQFGNYSAAQQRLEYIIGINPSYPGAMEKLTEVMVLSSVPTATPVVSPTPELIIVEHTDYEGLFAQAQQLIATGQWQNAMIVLGTLRKNDPTFRTVQIDGMYYFALRNLGVDFIKAGNLEGGIYELTLAEHFAPLDNTALILRDSARAYITASSFWEVDWKRAAEGFYYLNGSGIWDGTMTGTERYRIAAISYADELFGRGNYCDAYEWYQNAQTAGLLDENSERNSYHAQIICYPATATPVPTSVATQPPPAATDPPATISGCTDPAANNYDPAATEDDGSCTVPGCTDTAATNFDPDATEDDGSCTY